ncbi:MAG TPA: hypothetical protein VF635_07090 [Propionibacteriaceae bacterium]
MHVAFQEGHPSRRRRSTEMFEEGVDPAAVFAALKGEAGDDFL